MGSGFKNFGSEVLTSNDVDGYLMRQTVMTFASAAARDSALSGVLDEGMTVFLRDNDQVTYYTGSAWKVIYQPATAFTPTWSGLTLGAGTNTGYYSREGDMVTVHVLWTYSSGAVSTDPTVTNLPVAASTSVYFNGSGHGWDNSATTTFPLGCTITSASSLLAICNNGHVTASLPFAWAANDRLSLSITYMAA